METVLVAVIAAVVGPSILLYFSGRQQSKDKREDWARQDKVAEKAAETARLVLAENKKAAVAAEKTNNQLNVIHTLVNSNMTAAMEAQLAALQGQLVMMNRLAEVSVPSIDEKAAIQAVIKQISELSAALKDRLAVTEIIEKEAEI